MELSFETSEIQNSNHIGAKPRKQKKSDVAVLLACIAT